MEFKELEMLEDGLLRDLLGGAALSRERVHEWPLSRVERIETSGGRYALKTWRKGTSVEPAFYAAVEHPLLVKPLGTGELGDSEWLLLPWLEASPEDWTPLTDGEICRRVRELRGIYAAWEGAPVFFDFSTRERFSGALEADREALLAGGLTEEEFDAALEWLAGPGAACWDAPVGLLHGDLKGENLLGDKLIDWQRPLRGPLPLEERVALFLEGRELNREDPFAALNFFYHANWLAWAFEHCLPLPVEREEAVERFRTGLGLCGFCGRVSGVH